MNKLPLLLFVLLVGCASVQPDAVYVEANHQSSLWQHFRSPPTDYGMDAVQATAEWRRGRWTLDVSDGYSLHGWTWCSNGCDPRDVFEARVKYEVWHK